MSKNWYLGVFGGEKSIATIFEILQAPEVATTDDDEKNHKQGIPLIAFSYVHWSRGLKIGTWGFSGARNRLQLLSKFSEHQKLQQQLMMKRKSRSRGSKTSKISKFVNFRPINFNFFLNFPHQKVRSFTISMLHYLQRERWRLQRKKNQDQEDEKQATFLNLSIFVRLISNFF